MPTKKSLTKDDWLEAAMEMLRSQGIGGVRVLPLAKKLRVSRGSFYWHFEDLQDLKDSMLGWWDREMTESVIELANATRGSAEKRLIAAGKNILTAHRNRYELAIRSWAEDDKKAARVLRRVVRKRLDYITSLFADAGFSPAEARARGELVAVYLMSEEAILMDESLKGRLRLFRRQVRSLMS
ncbi:MAG: TetR/AcrR family transcriptional regulator [Myxococcales bacterium]|nr:TetR/AcrR family transcriptional regulator [Myxococcales bacterium]MDH3842336.1 TetR/AcrR family transcriptional regulator [Myxococcales bacterium]